MRTEKTRLYVASYPGFFLSAQIKTSTSFRASISIWVWKLWKPIHMCGTTHTPKYYLHGLKRVSPVSCAKRETSVHKARKMHQNSIPYNVHGGKQKVSASRRRPIIVRARLKSNNTTCKETEIKMILTQQPVKGQKQMHVYFRTHGMHDRSRRHWRTTTKNRAQLPRSAIGSTRGE